MDSDKEVNVSLSLLHKSSSSLAESTLTSAVRSITLLLTTSKDVGDRVAEELEHIALNRKHIVRNARIFKPKEGLDYAVV